jgi:hypothetical protein
MEDYLRGQRYPLSLIHTDANVIDPQTIATGGKP